MRLGNRRKMLAGLAIVCLLFNSTGVSAAKSLAVVESCTKEAEVVLYLKGVPGKLTDVQVQAGTAVCDDVTAGTLEESGQPVKTLILLDNSLSVQKAECGQLETIVADIMSGRMEQEEMALAIFQEEVTYLADYTSDDAVLKDAAANISYQSSNTYLTDVLYELLSAWKTDHVQDVFRRIVVISDGMDNKSIGYTKDELTALVKEYPVPIYTVGIQTKKKDNQEQLKNMFAISRMTGAESFLLGETKELQQISQALREDGMMIRLVVRPPDELLDGSRKMFKITLASGESVSVEAALPQQTRTRQQTDGQHTAAELRNQTELETGETTESKNAQEPENTRESKDAQDTKKPAGKGILTVVLTAACLLVSVAVFAVFLKKKKAASVQRTSQSMDRKYRDASDRIDTVETHTGGNGRNQNDLYDADRDDAETDLMEATETIEDDHTVSMCDPDDVKVCNLILTDIRTPERSFQIPLQTVAVIGRRQGMCNLIITDDMSVSGRHCQITNQDGNFYIQDLQSSNGTFVDGKRIWAETGITSGSIIKMGKSEFKFEVW